MQALLPDPRFRSPTGAAGMSDVRDENVYSAVVVQHSGTGSARCFSVPQGQSIPKMNGSVTASTQAHQGVFSDTTTNLTKPSELGATLGDGSIRAIGITIEQAAITLTTGLPRAFGATQFEMADILSKTSFEFRIGGKRQILGPTYSYPSLGHLAGSVSTTGTAATSSVTAIGGAHRRLKVPVPVARNDTLEGVFNVATGASFAFSTTTGEGQPTLVWFHLLATVKGDVR